MFVPPVLIASILASPIDFPNVRLVSKLDEQSTKAQIESLLLMYEFFQIMLRSEWEERTTFQEGRVIALQELSSSAIGLRVHFARVGLFPPGQILIEDLVVLMSYAERSPRDSHLRSQCVRSLMAISTWQEDFIHSLRATGTAFDVCGLKMVIVNSWASQGRFTREYLLEEIEKSIEAERQV